MKLSQPGSSSDIEAAREAAQRLNRVAIPPEPARPLPPYAPVASGFRTAEPSRPGPVAPPPAVVPPPAPVAPPLPPPVAEAAQPSAMWQRHAEAEPPPLPEPASPESDGSAAPGPLAAEASVVAEPPAVEDVEEAVEPEPPPVPAVVEPPVPVAAAPAPVASPASAEVIEEPVGVADEPEAEPAPATPLSWPDVTRSCLVLAEAKGALLITPEGKVIAVAGEWPPPGAEAIASRLVPAMDKALKDAPTRSVSVPLGGLHLTAWRVPVDTGGLMTVGFVADTPLRPDLRPGIDAELRRGGDA